MKTPICIGLIAVLSLGFSQGAIRGKNLLTRRDQTPPKVKKLTEAQLRQRINRALSPRRYDGPLGQGPMIDARTPWIAEANIDVYHSGRWDTTYNSVYFTGIHSTGPSVGQWDGTVGYVYFKPPSTGTYLIITHFTGYKIQCNVKGPWGTNSATTSTTSDDGVVTTLYNATTTNKLSYTFSFKTTDTGWGMGYWYGTEFIKL